MIKSQYKLIFIFIKNLKIMEKIEATKIKKKSKKSKGCISMKFAVIISYIVSIISNIILSIIFHLTEHSYKWIGYLIHFLLLFCIFYSLKLLLLPTSKIVKKYITITKFFTMVLMSSTIFYFSIFVYMFIQKIDKEISYFYGFCILICSLYHYILISIIFSYIQAISDRPEEVQGKKAPKVDKDLEEIMLNDLNK